MTQEHVLAREEQMIAAQTKQHEEEKHAINNCKGRRNKKSRKPRQKSKKIVLQASIVTKASRLCYRADCRILHVAATTMIPQYIQAHWSSRNMFSSKGVKIKSVCLRTVVGGVGLFLAGVFFLLLVVVTVQH